VLFSALIGAIVGSIWLALKGRDRATPIPFGPYLAGAGWVQLMYGEAIVGGMVTPDKFYVFQRDDGAEVVIRNMGYKDKKIVIREIWSSPIVFRRASKTHTLCDDAKAFNTEARRRVQANRDKDFAVRDGDRIQIMGEDIDGKKFKLSDYRGKVVEIVFWGDW